MHTPAIVVHGGASTVGPGKLAEAYLDGTKRAARAGYHVLKTGGSAVDAVEAAVSVLEDDYTFNAGRGSVLNWDGKVEMDALIMEGGSLNSGAVTCVKNVQNPIKLARQVMEKTAHCLLSEKGAEKFAEEIAMPSVSPEVLVTDRAKSRLKAMKDKLEHENKVSEARDKDDHDTVGAVAVDKQGTIAVATSTGGRTGKKVGRVGDSPIMGAGGYADNEVGGVSTTGQGESIYKLLLAYQIIYRMKQGETADKASQDALSEMLQRVGGYCGVIVIDKDSNVTKSCTTGELVWASIKQDILHYGVNTEEDIVEPL